jgi:hypothetical protein
MQMPSCIFASISWRLCRLRFAQKALFEAYRIGGGDRSRESRDHGKEAGAYGILSEKPAGPSFISISLEFKGFTEIHGLASKAPSGNSSATQAPWPRLIPSGSLPNTRITKPTAVLRLLALKAAYGKVANQRTHETYYENRTQRDCLEKR